MAIMAGSIMAGKHGTGAVAGSSHLDTAAMWYSEIYLGMAWGFETSLTVT